MARLRETGDKLRDTERQTETELEKRNRYRDRLRHTKILFTCIKNIRYIFTKTQTFSRALGSLYSQARTMKLLKILRNCDISTWENHPKDSMKFHVKLFSLMPKSDIHSSKRYCKLIF